MVDAGTLISIVIAISVAGIVLYSLGSEVLTQASSYNTSACTINSTGDCVETQTTGTMAVLFGGTIFIVLCAVAMFKKAGLF